MELYTVDELTRKSKTQKIKSWFTRKARKAETWIYNNREMIMILGPSIIAGTATVARVVGKHVNLRKEEKLKDLYCYDRSLGHYWALRRELTNKEWVEIDKRKQNGERLADILSELKVLK